MQVALRRLANSAGGEAAAHFCSDAHMRHIYLLLLCLAVLPLLALADVEIGAKEWDETLANNQQTIVKFYSPYCGWCQKFAPLWTELTKAFDGVLKVVAVNVLEHKQLASDENISGVPTVRLYNGKTSVGDFRGPRTQDDISKWIFEKLLPIKLEYASNQWRKYITNPYTQPTRFLYLYPKNEEHDTQKLYESIRHRGVFAECAIPVTHINTVQQNFELPKFPILVTTALGVFTPVEEGDIAGALERPGLITNGKVPGAKVFGGSGGESDAHGFFTFVFLMVGIVGLVIFAWRKILPPRKSHDSAKMV